MKKITLLLLACITTSLSYSQDIREYEEIDETEAVEEGKKFYFGVVGGYNHSNIGKTLSSREKGGFYTGVMLESYIEKDILSVQMELIYTQMGVRMKDQATLFHEGRNDKISVDYLAYTLAGKAYIDDFNFHFGLLLGLVVKRESEINGVKKNLNEEVKNYTGGFIIGAGYRLTNNLSFDLRGYFSDTISKEEELEDGSNRRVIFNVSFGFSLRF